MNFTAGSTAATSTAGAVRYWMSLYLESPSNSTMLREVLRTGRDRGRDLWAGRVEYTASELERLCAILQLPVEAFTNFDVYRAQQRREDALSAALAVVEPVLVASPTENPGYLIEIGPDKNVFIDQHGNDWAFTFGSPHDDPFTVDDVREIARTLPVALIQLSGALPLPEATS